ncbi:MAG: NB-ARC domain-containing protein, partial [Gammaproteobacteria bacterium]
LVLYNKIEQLLKDLTIYYEKKQATTNNNFANISPPNLPVPAHIQAINMGSGVAQVIINQASSIEQLSQFERYMRSYPKTNRPSEPYVEGCHEIIPDSYVNREILVQGTKTVNAASILQTISQQTGHYTQLLVGNGGVGKTCLASAYFEHARKTGLYDVMLWTDALELMDFFKELIPSAGVKVHNKLQAKNWIRDIYRVFNQVGKLLLVIDNVISPTQCVDETTETTVSDFLWPQSIEASDLRHFIVTSRYQSWFERLGQKVAINEFQPQEAIACLTKLLPLSKADQEKEKLYKRLASKVGYLPLALPITAAYIKQFDEIDAAVEDFIKQYDKFYKTDFLMFEEKGQLTGIATIGTLWHISLRQLLSEKQELAIKALCYLSYMECGGISEILLARILDLELPPIEMNRQNFYTIKLRPYLQSLFDYSLIEKIATKSKKYQESSSATVETGKLECSKSVRIHSLLQDAIQLWQRKGFDEKVGTANSNHAALLTRLSLADNVSGQWQEIVKKIQTLLDEIRSGKEQELSLTSLLPHIRWLVSEGISQEINSDGLGEECKVLKNTLLETAKRDVHALMQAQKRIHHELQAQRSIHTFSTEPLSNLDTASAMAIEIAVCGVNKDRIRFQLPPQREDFIKREDDIIAVNTALIDNKITQIKGFGGTGKTQLAVGVVYDKETEYDDIIWIDAEVNIPVQVKALIQGIYGIAEEMPLDEMLEVLYDKQRISKRVLWVFDNVKQTEDIKLYYPPADYTGMVHILLTSRVGIIDSCHELAGFSEAEGCAYIKQQLREALLPDDQQTAKIMMVNLLKTVSHLPLALAHAVAYIKQPEHKCSINDYSNHFKIQLSSFKNDQGDKSLETVRTSVSLSFIALKKHHSQAWEILQSCVGLPARAMPVRLLIENQIWLGILKSENSEFRGKEEGKLGKVQLEMSLGN